MQNFIPEPNTVLIIQIFILELIFLIQKTIHALIATESLSFMEVHIKRTLKAISYMSKRNIYLYMAGLV